MSDSTYVYVDVRTEKHHEGVRIRVAWGMALSIDLEMIRQMNLGEASIESRNEPNAVHLITFKHNASCKEQAAVLAKYFEIVARPSEPTGEPL